MFLNQLTPIEKDSFLSLSVHAANSNGEFAAEEEEMIEEYCREMGVPFFNAKNVDSIENIIDTFKEAEDSHKKIVLLEILGLLFADGVYDEKEENFVKEYAKKIGLAEAVVEEQTKLIIEYVKLTNRIAESIKN